LRSFISNNSNDTTVLVRRLRLRDKRRDMLGRTLRTCARWALDFALPPRCAGCGVVVADVHSFCVECWKRVEFLGSGGYQTCGMPLRATDIDICAACLARPPRIARTRAAVAYDELSRSVAIRLKYGRKVAAAKTMARYMLPLIAEGGEERRLVPVPLHRSRWRGFNQSALVAHQLSKGLGVGSDPFALKRIRRTPLLKGMSALQRGKAVRRGLSRARRSGDRRQDHRPGRRRSDHRQQGRGLRAGAKAGWRRPGRARQLGARGAPQPVDALTIGPR
jgi:predicted amidophosphoribosyltransferase